jgi:hypothetical protein
MPKIQGFVDLGQIKTPDEFIRHGSQAIQSTVDVVNGKLEFDSNLNTKTITVTFAQANTDTPVTHNLGRVPGGYLPGKRSVNCSVFDGTKQDTTTVSYLQCSQPATVTLIFY